MKPIQTILAASLMLCGGQLAAQETRVGEEGFESPPAGIYEMYWLEGLWLGTGIGGAPATTSAGCTPAPSRP